MPPDQQGCGLRATPHGGDAAPPAQLLPVSSGHAAGQRSVEGGGAAGSLTRIVAALQRLSVRLAGKRSFLEELSAVSFSAIGTCAKRLRTLLWVRASR
jgi:hypothetical protein